MEHPRVRMRGKKVRSEYTSSRSCLLWEGLKPIARKKSLPPGVQGWPNRIVGRYRWLSRFEHLAVLPNLLCFFPEAYLESIRFSPDFLSP